jgi:hypothetical protein
MMLMDISCEVLRARARELMDLHHAIIPMLPRASLRQRDEEQAAAVSGWR